ncbi:unnamed protein product [Tilletia controversa]|uniref:N-acetylgalactosaminide beta-1,3-galactosyltransferase n=3 Tax=Tilletia TaxID=13289 RepID=A0A8X7MSJ8_9BASI|nr:hypothetical protein CF328_g4249 [Tilletia controversa]KAE8196609.1 hypothetical protein CF336_g2544 [Tilletia laevis]KAE8259839.1 hypothetical protein A4X03_0g3976 [Tilletia caries]KAE8201197.1 hypothetical protein CF335_g3793 [Tilletia laevis]KAE8246525.1 hypothetical protein A4X06_0g4982 [Tilletia controversa]
MVRTAAAAAVEYIPLGTFEGQVIVPEHRKHGGRRRFLVGGFVVLLLLMAVPLFLILGGRGWPPNAHASKAPMRMYSELFRGGADIRPINDKVVLMLKTGHSIIYERIPLHFIEPRPDIPNRLIYSDVPLQIAGFPVVDALANLTDFLSHSPDLSNEYNRLQKAHQNGDNVAPTSTGWTLDRFKFAPLTTHAWKTYPNATWYITIDGDSYLMWSTLLRWLEQYFDRPESNPWYLGYDEVGDEDEEYSHWHFAHGGAGFAMSRGLVEALHRDDGDGYRFHRDLHFKDIGCGDCAMGAVIADLPGRNGHTDAGRDLFHHDGLDKLIFRPRLWHTYVLSLHHNAPDQLNLLRQWEKRFLPTIPEWDGVRQCDVLYGLTPTFLRNPLQVYLRAVAAVNNSTHSDEAADAARQELARLNRTVIQPAWKADEVDHFECEGACLAPFGGQMNAEICDRVCDAHKNCYGWQLGQSSCSLALNGFRIGTPIDPNFQISTAWRLDRIAALESAMPCSDLDFRRAADERGHGLVAGRSDRTRTGLDEGWVWPNRTSVASKGGEGVASTPLILPQGPRRRGT